VGIVVRVAVVAAVVAVAAVAEDHHRGLVARKS